MWAPRQPWIYFALAMLAITAEAVIAWMQPGAVIGFDDPDVWVRLSRVLHLYDTHAWYDRTVRLNPPLGIENHWTRPLDIFYLLLALPATAVASFKTALLAAALVSNLVLILLLAAAIWRLCRLLKVGLAGQWVAALLLLPSSVSYLFAVGRADHHGLLLCLFAWILVMLARFFLLHDARALLRSALLAGLGLWVSPEYLAVIALVIAALSLRWVMGDAQAMRHAARWTALVLAVAMLAVMLEWPPHQWLTESHIRISALHVAMLAGLLFALGALSRLRLNSPPARLLSGILAAGLLLAGLLWLDPRIWLGPMADTPPELVSVFSKLPEEVPLFADMSFAALLCYIAPELFIAGWYAHACRRTRQPLYLLLCLCALGFTGLTLTMVRWHGYALVAGIPGWASLTGLLAARFASFPWLRQQTEAARSTVAAQAVLMLAFIMPILATQSNQGAKATPEYEACRENLRLFIQQQRLESPDARPLTILTDNNAAGALLFWTPHYALASNFNYNADALRDLEAFLYAKQASDAERIVRKYHVDFVLLCSTGHGYPLFYNKNEPAPFLHDLGAGKFPRWLAPVSAKTPRDLLFLKVK